MSDATPSRRQWRIGELAEIAGTTVRALHHYEQHGLLPAPERSEGGHRVYDGAAVERIYRILALRELGLSLEEIRAAIGGGAPLGELLRAHLGRVEEKISRLTLLRDRLSALTSQPAAPISVDELVATLAAMSRVERHSARRRAAGLADPGGEAAWRALGERLREAMEAGASPLDGEVREIALAAQERIRRFTGGDAQVSADLARLREASPPRDLAGWTPHLMRFLHLAIDALPDAEEEAPC